jgi:hypothetical protein
MASIKTSLYSSTSNNYTKAVFVLTVLLLEMSKKLYYYKRVDRMNYPAASGRGITKYEGTQK